MFTKILKRTIQKLLNSYGFEVIRMSAGFTAEELDVMRRVKGLTATSVGRIVGLMDAVGYVSANRIDGAIVECGVWRGGSVMAALYTLVNLRDTTREVYLFDTFEGMSPPTEKDVMFDGTPARSVLNDGERTEHVANYWCYAGLELVRRNVLSTGYPTQRVHFVKGRVEDTLPGNSPERIALLRLDTDWYESTKHELVHLFPKLAEGGVLIIDDYGHWQGARAAVDEYFRDVHPFMSRLDYTGRLIIKR